MGGPISFLIGMFGLGVSGAMCLVKSAELEVKNREFLSHNYINYMLQMKLEENASYYEYFGGYNTRKIEEAIYEKYPNIQYPIARRVLVVGLAKHFTELMGYEYNYNSGVYNIWEYNIDFFIDREYRMDNIKEIVNTPLEKLKQNSYLMTQYCEYRRPYDVAKPWLGNMEVIIEDE